MISVSEKKWEKQKVNKNLVEKVKQDYRLSDILSQLIISRNYDASEIYSIKNNQKLINKFENDYDYQKASLILLDAIKNNENICILGDYDVDGTCATSLLVRYFNHINQKHFFYIPDRVNDGYGASKKLFQKLILKKPKLIIMVDCGSTSNEAIDYLNQNNIRSIIIDHHEINKPYPKSNALINPKKELVKKENSYLCATALTYFFIDILIKQDKSNFELSNFLIYVLLGTICDVMPLRKINKVIAHKTLEDFNIKNNAAFSYIFDRYNLNKKITVDDLGFLIGPIKKPRSSILILLFLLESLYNSLKTSLLLKSKFSRAAIDISLFNFLNGITSQTVANKTCIKYFLISKLDSIFFINKSIKK